MSLSRPSTEGINGYDLIDCRKVVRPLHKYMHICDWTDDPLSFDLAIAKVVQQSLASLISHS